MLKVFGGVDLLRFPAIEVGDTLWGKVVFCLANPVAPLDVVGRLTGRIVSVMPFPHSL